ncbi:AraC family transcriptional regulator [Paenibacillus donghaensis]|uniref:Transcriptional regulator n=1 Tax=Paenibacillus donghaensis TaxID=414771 RepID=A0A2Z2KQ73_9BACL|nr:AraC family transcriptional regulator [Paenibacillus donghaensis]ASA25940.1 transcriptional regulator [Paenibacillus donghaensis]
MPEIAHRRIVFAQDGGQQLPITLDSMGYNPNQEKFSRPEGYHTYHWIQTAKGEGTIHFDNKTISLSAGSGVLLLPHVPHSYESASARAWHSYYLTFGGNSAHQILEDLGLRSSAFYRWEEEAPLSLMLKQMLDRHDAAEDMFSLGASTDAYRFLLTLGKYGQLHNNTAISRNVDKLQPLLKWMDIHYGDPDIGLYDLAEQLEVSGRYLNSLFLQTFGLSPYAYFVRLRIRKSKELLVSQPQLTVKAISRLVGFRDASHYVATFRKQSGTTPEQFRRLN